MKIYTQAEFDALPSINGFKQCPPGDYSAINFGNSCSFGNSCRFGNSCSFDNWCRFGNSCSFGNGCRFEGGHKAKTTRPFLAIAGAGSQGRTSYFFDFVDGIFVRSGCFFGTLAEFRDRVIETCPDETDIKRLQYLGFSNIVAATFGGDII